jgi:hypothetical protein
MMRKKWIFLAPLALVGFVLFIALGGVVVRQLWNWLLPNLFGFHQINFWQALGLLALCRILFGGFGFHGRSRSHVGRRMRENWQHMTPEEREQFRQRIRTKWGFGPPAGESKGEA